MIPAIEPQQRRLARAVPPDEPDRLAAARPRAETSRSAQTSVACVCPRWTKRSFSVRASRAWTRKRRETPSTEISPTSIAT